MLRNYLIIAFRNLWRNKVFSAINIVGLALGIAFIMLIGAFVWEELQVNHGLRDYDRVYIIESKWTPSEMGWPLASPPVATQLLKQNYPHLIEGIYRIGEGTVNITRKDNEHFSEDILLTDSTTFTDLGIPFLYGNTSTALLAPYSVVITQSAALKYFGKTNVLGQSLLLETDAIGKRWHKITGIIGDMPRTSLVEFSDERYRYNIFLPIQYSAAYRKFDPSLNSWYAVGGYVGFIKIKPNVAIADVEKALADMIKKHAPTEFQGKLAFKPISLSNYHITKGENAIKKMLYTLSTVALFILLMAVVNFVNLSIGNSINRSKEIGIRKTMGGHKSQLVLQFLTESSLLTWISALIAVVLYELLRPYFQQVIGREVLSIFQFQVFFVVVLVLSISFIGLIAGIFPAFVLSSFEVIDSLRQKIVFSKTGILFRKVLVVVQITLAVAISITAIIISLQISYIDQMPLGYEKDNMLIANGFTKSFSVSDLQKAYVARNAIASIPNVKGVSLSWTIPNDGNYCGTACFYLQEKNEQSCKQISVMWVDKYFASTYGLKVLEGQFFSENDSINKSAMMVNEAAAKLLGISNFKNQIIRAKGEPESQNLVGIVKDFNLMSLHEGVKPIVFMHISKYSISQYLSFHLISQNDKNTISAIKMKYAEFFPDAPFNSFWLGDKLKQLYVKESQLKRAVDLAVILSLIIVMVGLIGLVSLTITRRTKEIGIRKILGSSVLRLNYLLVRQFVDLIVISNVIAWGVAYWVASTWLESFAYRITLLRYLWIFPLAGLAIMMLAVFIISIQTIAAALANPVKSLRSE